MSEAGAFLRDRAQVASALADAETQWHKARTCGVRSGDARETAEILRNEQLLAASCAYLEAILHQLDRGVGSRGGAAALSPDGIKVHPGLAVRIRPEDPAFRGQVETTELREGRFVSGFSPARPVPETDGWFETVWSECREGAIYE